MLPNPASFPALRAAVHACDALIQPKRTAAAHSAFSAYPHWRRQLARAAACPRYDTLAEALKGLDALRAVVETAHASNPFAGIQRLRKTLDVIEAFIEQVELAGEEVEEPVDPVLDNPVDGVLRSLHVRLGFPLALAALATDTLSGRKRTKPTAQGKAKAVRPRSSSKSRRASGARPTQAAQGQAVC